MKSGVPVRGVTNFDTSRPIAFVSGSDFNNFSRYSWEFEIVNANEPFTGNYFSISSFTDIQPLEDALQALPNYDSNKGFKIAWKCTRIATNENLNGYWSYINIPVSLDLSYEATDAWVTTEGGGDLDIYEMRLKSDTSVVYSWQGVGRYDFSVGPVLGEEVYIVRYILSDGTYDRAASSKPYPTTIIYGDNGVVKLYVGQEIQVASSDPATIWNYANRTLTEGFEATDREQLNKALTTGKFLALK